MNFRFSNVIGSGAGSDLDVPEGPIHISKPWTTNPPGYKVQNNQFTTVVTMDVRGYSRFTFTASCLPTVTPSATQQTQPIDFRLLGNILGSPFTIIHGGTISSLLFTQNHTFEADYSQITLLVKLTNTSVATYQPMYLKASILVME